MGFGPRPAYLTSGKRTREVLVVDTATGLTPHLAWAGQDAGTKTFCGRSAHHLSGTWFQLTGCRKCRAAALTQDLARITDVDGEELELATL